MLFEGRGITKRFGGLVAIDGLDIAIPQGKITALIGPNGAGKSTCFNVMCGFYPVTSGTLNFAGEDVTALPAHPTCDFSMPPAIPPTSGTNSIVLCTALDNRETTSAAGTPFPATSPKAMTRRLPPGKTKQS